jgi:hypothetical protein
LSTIFLLLFSSFGLGLVTPFLPVPCCRSRLSTWNWTCPHIIPTCPSLSSSSLRLGLGPDLLTSISHRFFFRFSLLTSTVSWVTVS